MEYTTLWQLDNNDGTMSARARMWVGDNVIDETITVPLRLNEGDKSSIDSGAFDGPIRHRMDELNKSVTPKSNEAEQIVVPVDEVQPLNKGLSA